MWCVVCSSINCLLTDSLISGKFLNQRNKTTVTQSSNNNYAVDNIENSTNSILNILDPKNFGESRSALVPHKRVKRVQIFRPLFVYRQEKIERQRIIENRKFSNRKINGGIERKNAQPYHNCKCCARN